ncbi:MAG: hypothetical protein WCA35_14695, partial [Kovacikia sp.]
VPPLAGGEAPTHPTCNFHFLNWYHTDLNGARYPSTPPPTAASLAKGEVGRGLICGILQLNWDHFCVNPQNPSSKKRSRPVKLDRERSPKCFN